MIICFTGTGNTRYISEKLQHILGDEILRLGPGVMRQPEKAKVTVTDGRIIWATPIFCWGLPPLVEEIIKSINIESTDELQHYLVCTCGDDIGNAARRWRSLITARGFVAMGAYSVQMPNNYVAMKGFDVDPLEVVKAKLDAAGPRVEEIAHSIAEGEFRRDDVVRGTWPWLKSTIINAWFYRKMYSTKPFHVTAMCTGCGRCQRNCPVQKIHMVDGRPQWESGRCIMCLRCYHCCPQHAIAYGKATHDKGQYLCPGYHLS